MKSKFDIALGDTSPSQFDIRHVMPGSGYVSEDVEFSNNSASVFELKDRMYSRIPSRIKDIGNGRSTSCRELNNSRSTISHKTSADHRTSEKHVPPVEVTDKNFVHGGRQHYDPPVKSNNSCVNKTAERQVPFPRSNRAGMHVRESSGRYGNTVMQWEKEFQV